jgi:hypothetical protein
MFDQDSSFEVEDAGIYARPDDIGGRLVHVDQLQSIFESLAGPDQHIDRDEFSRIYLKLHPQAESYPNYQEWIKNTFLLIDSNRSGKISFNEFVAGYQKLRGYHTSV